MRTVADAGTMSVLVTAQTAATRTPYQKMLFTDVAGTVTVDLSTTSATFPNRILSIDHREESWNDAAYVVLDDHDRTIPDLRGYWTEIGYGLTIAASAAYALTPRLWVKHQEIVWARSQYTTVLELEGMWARLNEMAICSTVANSAGTYNPAGSILPMPPYASGSTVYQAMSSLMNGWGLTLAGTSAAEDDSVYNANTMDFYINLSPNETRGQVVRGLMSLTYNYLLAQTALTFKGVYTANTVVDYTYYRDTAPQYYSFVERQNTIAPNKSYVFANKDAAENYTILASTTDAAGTAQYLLTPTYGVAPSVASSAEAVVRAQVYLSKLLAQATAGRVVVQHDSQIEMYDRIRVIN